LGIIKEIQNAAGALIAICDYSGDPRYYVDALKIPTDDLKELDQINARRKQEILTSRYLIQHLMGKNIWSSFKKDGHGKPYIDGSDLFISLSHSYNRSAAIVSEKQVGIDLQKHVKKIERIKQKFLNPIELQCVNNAFKEDLLHIYWGAKECMFKAYGKKEVDFKKHLFVDYIDTPGERGYFSSKMQKHEFNTRYTMYFEKLDDFFLVYGIPNDDKQLQTTS